MLKCVRIMHFKIRGDFMGQNEIQMNKLLVIFLPLSPTIWVRWAKKIKNQSGVKSFQRVYLSHMNNYFSLGFLLRIGKQSQLF